MAANTKVALTLSNSIIGVSILAMPFCMKQCGIVLGVLMLSLSSLLMRFTCHLLLKSAQVSRKKTFEFVALHTFGPIGKLAVELNIIGFMLGILISFFVVIGDLGPAIISNALGIENTETLRSMFLICIGLGVALPFAMLRELKSLAHISTLSIVFYTILSLNTATEALPVILSGSWQQRVHWWRPAGILHSLPIFALALSCQTQILEIYDTLPDPSLKHMNAVVKLAVSICATLYFMMGFFGYIAHHEQNFSGNILLSSSPGFVTEVMKLCFVLSVALSFPLVVLPCRTSIHSLLFKRAFTPFDVGSSYISEARFKGITVAVVIGTLIMGILCPNIELVLEFIGSTIGILICIIAPAVTFIQLTPKSTFEKWGAQFVFFAGILLLAFCTWVSLEPVAFPVENRQQSAESDNEMHPKDYANELKFGLPEFKSVQLDKRQEVIAPILEGASTSSMKPQSLSISKEKEISLERLSLDTKIEDVKRQEPPIPQEPEESLNEEFVENRAKEEDENKDKADAIIAKDGAMQGIERRPESMDAIKIDRENPDQMLIKQEELLKKMELQQEEQKKIIIEQREVLKELKAHGIIHQDVKGNAQGIEGSQDSKHVRNHNAALPVELPASKLLQRNDEKVQPEREIFKGIHVPLKSSVGTFQNVSKQTFDKPEINSIVFHKRQSNNRTDLHKMVVFSDQPEHPPQRKHVDSKSEPIMKNHPKLVIAPEELAQPVKSVEKNDSPLVETIKDGSTVSVQAPVTLKLHNDLQHEEEFQPDLMLKAKQPVAIVFNTVTDKLPNSVVANSNAIADGRNSVKSQPVKETAVRTALYDISSNGKNSLDKMKSSAMSTMDENNVGKRIGRDLKFST